MRRQSPKLARYRARHQAVRFNRRYQPQFFWYAAPTIEEIADLFIPAIDQGEVRWALVND